MLMKKLAAGAATTAIALSIGAVAHAQSTATQTQEVIVTGSRAPHSTGGLATQVNEAKDESVIGKAFIAAQLPSANVGQLINMLPGVSYSTEDPGGFNSGDLRIHGFDGAHVAFILDGAPLNDTGNYAVYPGEYMIGELIDHITVNIGSSDVDSPSASALGATINVVTKNPPKTLGGELKVSAGSYGYNREYGEFDTGAVGPFGTTAYVAAEHGWENNFEDRPGRSQRNDISGKIYQPLKGTDFISISGIYTEERQNPPFNVSASDMKALGRYYIGDNYTWTPEVAQPGVADSYPGIAGGPTQSTPGVVLTNGTNGGPKFSSDSNYYALFPNPVNFASIRGQSRFDLGHGVQFTFDPSFFYTLANGGGGTTLKETSPLLFAQGQTTSSNPHACISGGKVIGVDLNGDGDCKDTVVVYAPSNTETYRYSINSSLLYRYDERNDFLLAYTGDLGLHRQTGEYTYVNPLTGAADNVFGAKPGYGTPIITADGRDLQKRDRRSIALLNQVSANYIGKFMDDKLHINIGVRAPFFERRLNNYCDTYNGTSVYCAPINTAAVLAAYNTDLAANRPVGSTATATTAALASTIASTIKTGPNGVPNFRFPFQNYDIKFNKVLPNVGATYRLFDNNLVYVSYAQGFAAPKTDDLYTAPINNIQPETTDNYAIGYRYQTRALNASINLYDTEYKNRIEQTYDANDPTVSIDRNVGNARVRGIDLEVGWTPIEHLNLYGSANFNDSELKSNYNYQTNGVAFIVPAKGKSLVLTPDRTFSGRATYDFGPMTVGLQAKYISRRYVSDTNDSAISGYAVFGFDARYTLPYLDGRSFIQLNIQNLFNREYISRISTSSTVPFTTVPSTAPAGTTGFTPFYYVGAPSTFSLTIGARF